MQAKLIRDLWWGDAHAQCLKSGTKVELADIVLGEHATVIVRGHLYETKIFEVPVRLLETHPPLAAVAAEFYMDGSDVFKGWHRGDFWNGWACPFFEKEVAEEICKMVTRDGAGKWIFSAETDEFAIMFSDTRCYDDDCWDRFGGVDVQVGNGEFKHLYSIGGWSWCWDIKDDK